jgi:hypothetical protein
VIKGIIGLVRDRKIDKVKVYSVDLERRFVGMKEV